MPKKSQAKPSHEVELSQFKMIERMIKLVKDRDYTDKVVALVKQKYNKVVKRDYVQFVKAKITPKVGQVDLEKERRIKLYSKRWTYKKYHDEQIKLTFPLVLNKETQQNKAA